MTENMFKLCILVLGLIAQDCRSQDDEGPYRGKFIGKINSYHHQVSGDVYAIDEWTVLLVDFNYDGTGDDTFFWAGDSGRPGPQGFIVPDQNGKTNVLERYYNEEVRLTLPEGKRLSRVKWFAIYDIGSQNTFGDVFVPDEFEPPAPVTAGPLAGSGASSKPVQILDAATILIPELRYDGSGEEVYFWTGVGPQPSARGHKIPDEYGYLESIRSYSGEDVRLSLPGELTVFQLHWIAIYDLGSKQVLAWTPLPEAPNVPAPARSLHPHKSSLPQCRQLHRQYQAAWEVFGNQITIQLAGMIADDEYLAFGISGADDRSQMVGADVAVAYYDAKLQRGLATDYNITDKSPCVSVLGVWRGVCRDAAVGGLDDNQVFTAGRENGLTTVTYRRTLKPVQDMDREWPTDRPAYIVWAVGRRGGGDEPAHHLMYNRRDVMLNLTANPPDNDCVPFTVESPPSIPPWETAQLFSPAVRTFRLTVGPAGGRRGMLSRGGAPPPLAWYVAGQLAPDLMMRRGLTYTFTVSGGNDPHSATEYHPLVISSQRRWAAAGRLEPNVLTGVLAGVTTSRRGRPAAAAAGPPCRGSRPPERDPRRDDDFTTFRGFNRSLVWTCSSEAGAELRVTPDTSWPDTVYYHSFTHADMGGRILIVDRHRRAAGRTNAAAIYRPMLALTIAAGVAAGAMTGTR